MRTFRYFTASLALLGCFALASGARAQKQVYTDPKDADADFAVQGEYVGEVTVGGEAGKYGVQVIALGKGKFQAVKYTGGLPGDGWNEKDKIKVDGQTEGDVTTFKSPRFTLKIKDGVMTATDSGGEKRGTLKKVLRKSPTLGAKPPEGAMVIFDGKGTDHFAKGKMTDDGLLMQGAVGKDRCQSYSIHLEFLLPYMPEARGQGRANSGFYAQGRYEVQMLDSFGLEGEDNECGGIYHLAKPRINMCYPPLSWQTYDIDFTAPEFKDGKKVKNTRMTVKLNGVVIHDDLELKTLTPGGLDNSESPEPGVCVFLQNHGNPVRYRNIWVVESK